MEELLDADAILLAQRNKLGTQLNLGCNQEAAAVGVVVDSALGGNPHRHRTMTRHDT